MLVKGLESRQRSYLGLIEKWGVSETFEQWLKHRNKQQSEIFIAPFKGRYGLVWLIFDREAKYLGYLET